MRSRLFRPTNVGVNTHQSQFAFSYNRETSVL